MRHLLGLYRTSAEEIARILQCAADFKQQWIASPTTLPPVLQGKTVVLAFFENSTRTRTSFELAVRRLSGSALNFSAATSSLQKGETLLDTIANIEAMQVDAFVIRHGESGAAEIVAKHTRKIVINAGDGMHEHPTQALLDMFTLQETFGQLSGLRVLILGDILHSRVARSNIFGLQKMGARVSVCAPPTLLPVGIEHFGVQVFTRLQEALQACDAVIVLRLQLEREAAGFVPTLREYNTFFALTDEALAKVTHKVFVLHPGPVNREIELSSVVTDRDDTAGKSESLILKQVTNGVAVRMAVLSVLFGHTLP
ncbi:MAG: aspartate carbamoyltransferase catalytic subunit [Chloroherpetonaceae bacterium]|nr:aspartate carbamoyltransferase catalytic subunit [Chloroherpetonaceae bacterium]MCS7212007.1 aspartate carbamoyltransferase catalytic subunit [Chloroherpetonaceae bacterium]MDW8019133.1 aspartate carbamoyltransferase catalytic subunit [Chloroherpetonaceae bacterium]MDW8466922.1 aspartate carbamoyltransferase catalytic subunit [Chloroherpetonaceae bacterium]